jgi:hypothetical protein
MMAKYRKLPVEVEAVQVFLGKTKCDMQPEWFRQAIKDGIINRSNYTIKTLEGDMKISDGDYIIQGANGEIYPCKPDIFGKTYEAVE